MGRACLLGFWIARPMLSKDSSIPIVSSLSAPLHYSGFWTKSWKQRKKMAMAQWCGAVARGVMAAERRSPSLTSSMVVEGLVPILCGRGDKKTKKGKRFKGSYGNARPKKEKKIQRIKDKIEVPSSTPWPLPFKLIWFESLLFPSDRIRPSWFVILKKNQGFLEV